MERKLVIILLACVSLLSGACNKFSNGEVTEKEYTLEQPFQIIELCDNVNVTLKHCDAQHQAGLIHIKTGENLIDNISTEIEETVDKESDLVFNKLIIRNDNTLDFLRPYDYTLETTVYYDTIFSVIFNSNAVFVSDTLRGYNYPTPFDIDSTQIDSLVSNLHLDIVGGSGDFTVLTNCYRIRTRYDIGTSTITVKGIVKGSLIRAGYECHGIIDCEDLETHWTSVNSYGTNTVVAKAFNDFSAKNQNIGRIYYKRYEEVRPYIHYGHYDPDGHWISNDTIDSTYRCPVHLRITGDNIMELPANGWH